MMIPARKAAIFWGQEGEVQVHLAGSPTIKNAEHLRWSGGACYAFWQKASTEELYFRLMQQFASMVRKDGIPVENVHRAFLQIPEYRATLAPEEQGAYVDGEEPEAELPKNFSSGYNF